MSSREPDNAHPQPRRGGPDAYPSGTPPYGTGVPGGLGADPAAGRNAPDRRPEEPEAPKATETKLTTRVRINIPGSRPIPPVVVQSKVKEEKPAKPEQPAEPSGPRHRGGAGDPVLGVMDSGARTATPPNLPPEWQEPAAPRPGGPKGSESDSTGEWFKPRQKGRPEPAPAASAPAAPAQPAPAAPPAPAAQQQAAPLPSGAPASPFAPADPASSRTGDHRLPRQDDRFAAAQDPFAAPQDPFAQQPAQDPFARPQPGPQPPPPPATRSPTARRAPRPRTTRPTRSRRSPRRTRSPSSPPRTPSPGRSPDRSPRRRPRPVRRRPGPGAAPAGRRRGAGGHPDRRFRPDHRRGARAGRRHIGPADHPAVPEGPRHPGRPVHRPVRRGAGAPADR
ncbi:hypothetical protein ACFQ2M_26365 [Kitasatospora saccharophila]|uniref:hypothetical protein n=1 Tax=Kitasatospora saccharophila TaxID=407973 RepID=UPI00363A426D